MFTGNKSGIVFSKRNILNKQKATSHCTLKMGKNYAKFQIILVKIGRNIDTQATFDLYKQILQINKKIYAILCIFSNNKNIIRRYFELYNLYIK